MLVPRHVWHFKIQPLAKKHLTQSAGEAECHWFGRRLHINKVLNVPARVHPETTFYVVFLVNISKDSVLFHQQKDCSHAGETDNSPRAKWAPGQWFLWSYYKLVKKTLTIKIFFFSLSLSAHTCILSFIPFHPSFSLTFCFSFVFLSILAFPINPFSLQTHTLSCYSHLSSPAVVGVVWKLGNTNRVHRNGWSIVALFLFHLKNLLVGLSVCVSCLGTIAHVFCLPVLKSLHESPCSLSVS